MLALPAHAFCSALKTLVFRCSSLSLPLALLVCLSMRFSFSGNTVKTNCLQLNITVKQTPAQGALKANHLSSASILVWSALGWSGLVWSRLRCLCLCSCAYRVRQHCLRIRLQRLPLPPPLHFSIHSQHNLLWFCIYFASQACLRL